MARQSKPVETIQAWIADYRGTERDFYRSGAGLLLLGFLLQIVARLAEIRPIFGVGFLFVTLAVSLYMAYRVRNNIRYLMPT